MEVGWAQGWKRVVGSNKAIKAYRVTGLVSWGSCGGQLRLMVLRRLGRWGLEPWIMMYTATSGAGGLQLRQARQGRGRQGVGGRRQ